MSSILHGFCSSFQPWVSALASHGDVLKTLRWKNSFLPMWLHGVYHNSRNHPRAAGSHDVGETLILTRWKGKDSHPKVIFWLPHRCPGTQELVTPHMSKRTHVRTHQTRKGKASKRRKAKKEKWWAASWQMTNVSNLQGEGSERLSMNSTAPLSRAQCLGGTPLDYPNCSHQAWPCQWLLRHRVLLWL